MEQSLRQGRPRGGVVLIFFLLLIPAAVIGQVREVHRYESGAVRDSSEYGIDGGGVRFFFYPNGALMAHETVGKEGLEGRQLYFYPDSTVQAEERWANGTQEDSSKYYHENGRLHRLGRFKDGLYTGTWKTYFDNGILERIGHYNRGLPDSVWVLYDREGRLVEEIEYQDGVPNGKARFYHIGKISSEGNYKSGNMFGKWYFYRKNGKLKSTKFFDARD